MAMAGHRCCLWLLAAMLSTVAGYRVLVVFPVMGKSHSILGEGYVNILLERGHQVTYITPIEMKIKHRNLTQVVIDIDMSVFKGDELMNIESLLTGTNPMLRNPYAMGFFGGFYSAMVLNNSKILDLIQDPTEKFDLVVAEWFFSELYAGFGAIFNCPLVWSSSMDVHTMVLRLVDQVPNPAYTPDLFSPSTPPFTFTQRVGLLWTTLKLLFLNEFLIMPQTTEAYDNSFGSAARKLGRTIPPYKELIYSAAMVMANSHPTLGGAPTLPQNVKEIGGYHITPPPPLPDDLQKIMDEAKDGVIYFSLGSNMKSKDMPETMKRQLLEMFGQLKQTVLWKFEADLTNVPSNVHVRAWMPQHSILNHRKLRAFITHGGILSMTETVHFGVPAVVIPLFADQFLNAHAAARKGFAVQVEFTYGVAADLKVAIEEILTNNQYRTRARQLSALYHDRPLSPSSELGYWLEHTARHGSLPHLRSPALALAWYQALYLDLLALVLFALIAVVVLVRAGVRRIGGGKKKKRD